MPGKHTCKSSCSAKIASKFPKAVYALLACWILLQAGNVWAQQSKREYIYLDGKLVSVVTGSVTPLVINVTSPTSNPTYSTNTSPITLSGSLSNNVGATQVTWSNDRGGSGTCSGTTTWTCSGIAMQIGRNVISWLRPH